LTFITSLTAGCGVAPGAGSEAAAALSTTAPTSCGHEGEPCCASGGACNGNGGDQEYWTLECNNGMCERCGVVGMKCCSLNEKYWCSTGADGYYDQSNQKYQCVNMICKEGSKPPPPLTCNGHPANGAQMYTLELRDKNKCADEVQLFANSLADAQKCATASGYEVMSGPPQKYSVAQRSTASGICQDMPAKAYSADDAKDCIHSKCRPGDECTEVVDVKCDGTTLGFVVHVPPTPSCSASSACSCTGQNCGLYGYVSCATINANQVAEIQNADGSWSTFGVAGPGTPIVLFNDYTSAGTVTYRVCNADSSPLLCTDPLTTTIAGTCTPPAPPPTCRTGYHWCGDEDGCYPNSRRCD
jgi:hypothetical protein